MEWSGDGIIIGTRKHGETSLIIELMTRERGRHLGLVRGGRSKKQRPVLQVGNLIAVNWRARLDEHLGMFTVEPLELNAARLLESRCAIHGIQLLSGYLRLLAERDPHVELYDAFQFIISHLSTPEIAGPLVARFELKLLEELGFGLNLDACAATGERADLIYVSPKSGNAVGAVAGEPWADKLLPLPAFLKANVADCSSEAFEDAMLMTGYFLERDVWLPRGMKPPIDREEFRKTIVKALPDAPAVIARQAG
ncbi:MAG: DNA repair protein RecO [Pseudomonadota bacterium]